jgi:hypothetical protein
VHGDISGGDIFCGLDHLYKICVYELPLNKLVCIVTDGVSRMIGILGKIKYIKK